MPIEEWEGYVEDISKDEFTVRLVNVKSNTALPEEMVTFLKSEITVHERKLLQLGAIVRWVIGKKNSQPERFGRFPNYTSGLQALSPLHEE